MPGMLYLLYKLFCYYLKKIPRISPTKPRTWGELGPYTHMAAIIWSGPLYPPVLIFSCPAIFAHVYFQPGPSRHLGLQSQILDWWAGESGKTSILTFTYEGRPRSSFISWVGKFSPKPLLGFSLERFRWLAGVWLERKCARTLVGLWTEDPNGWRRSGP